MVAVALAGLCAVYGRLAQAGGIEAAPRPVTLIPPGTVVADRAPQGWSHLIIKSRPRIAPESAGQISATTAQLASLLCTVMLADVRAAQNRSFPEPYYLDKVAVGLATNVNGQDMVVSSSTQAKLGANLGMLARMVLSGAEKQLEEMLCVVRGRTFAVLDAPTVMTWQQKHRAVVLRYVVLVEPRTGRLETLVWLLVRDDRGACAGPSSPLQQLAPGKIDDCQLHVDANEFTLGIPSSLAFGLVQIPAGRRSWACPTSLAPLAAASRLTPVAAVELEQQLWSLLERQ